MVLRNLRFASRASSRDGIGTTGAVRTDSGGDGCGLTSRELGGLNMENCGGGGREEKCAATTTTKREVRSSSSVVELAIPRPTPTQSATTLR